MKKYLAKWFPIWMMYANVGSFVGGGIRVAVLKDGYPLWVFVLSVVGATACGWLVVARNKESAR
jgi:hypothetical protein